MFVVFAGKDLVYQCAHIVLHSVRVIIIIFYRLVRHTTPLLYNPFDHLLLLNLRLLRLRSIISRTSHRVYIVATVRLTGCLVIHPSIVWLDL